MIHESESKHPSADGVSCDAAEAHARTMEKLAEGCRRSKQSDGLSKVSYFTSREWPCTRGLVLWQHIAGRRRSPFPVRACVCVLFPVLPPLPRRATPAGSHQPALSSRYDDTSLPPRRGAQVHAPPLWPCPPPHASPRQKLQPHQAVSRLPPHLLLSDAGGPRSGE